MTTIHSLQPTPPVPRPNQAWPPVLRLARTLLIIASASDLAAWLVGMWQNHWIEVARNESLELAAWQIDLLQWTKAARSLTAVLILLSGWGLLFCIAYCVQAIARARANANLPPVARVANLAARLRTLLRYVGFPGLAIIAFMVICTSDRSKIIVGYHFHDHLDILSRTNALAVLALGGVGMWNLERCLDLYARGILFSAANALYLRRVGYLTIFAGSGLYSVMVRLLLYRWLTQPMNFTIDIVTMFAGSVIVLISWVMLEGSMIREERDLTI